MTWNVQMLVDHGAGPISTSVLRLRVTVDEDIIELLLDGDSFPIMRDDIDAADVFDSKSLVDPELELRSVKFRVNVDLGGAVVGITAFQKKL